MKPRLCIQFLHANQLFNESLYVNRYPEQRLAMASPSFKLCWIYMSLCVLFHIS